jgi:hypothetical protein
LREVQILGNGQGIEQSRVLKNVANFATYVRQLLGRRPDHGNAVHQNIAIIRDQQFYHVLQ